jgi:hypothetical protein
MGVSKRIGDMKLSWGFLIVLDKGQWTGNNVLGSIE